MPCDPEESSGGSPSHPRRRKSLGAFLGKTAQEVSVPGDAERVQAATCRYRAVRSAKNLDGSRCDAVRANDPREPGSKLKIRYGQPCVGSSPTSGTSETPRLRRVALLTKSSTSRRTPAVRNHFQAITSALRQHSWTRGLPVQPLPLAPRGHLGAHVTRLDDRWSFRSVLPRLGPRRTSATASGGPRSHDRDPTAG